MSYTSLDHIKKLFSDSESAEEQIELFKEMTLLVLARATRADLVTSSIEVTTVQGILKDLFDEDVSEADIRVAASSELFERAPLDRYIVGVSAQLEVSQRQKVADALVSVFRADGKVTYSEVDFFNEVVKALDLTPAEIVGLVP